MKIPKKVQRLIDRREKLAKNLIDVCNELDTWLEKNGADFNDSAVSLRICSPCSRISTAA